MTKVVFSNTMEPGGGRIVIRGDLAGQLANLIAVHPGVLTAGPRMFDHLAIEEPWSPC